MGAVRLAELTRYLDRYLAIREVEDYPGAANGLQVEGPDEVGTVVGAVDACRATIEAAAARGADLLLVHHGLAWGAPFPVTGPRYRRIRLLVEHRLAVYGAHLPLDIHDEVGNNAILARMLGLEEEGRFAEARGVAVGRYGAWGGTVDELARRVEGELGRAPRVLAFGPERVRRLGIVSGSGGTAVREAADLGLDALLTGEASHPVYLDAEEQEIHLLLAGHYATETVGVRALARHLGERFGLVWGFVDHPTGL